MEYLVNGITSTSANYIFECDECDQYSPKNTRCWLYCPGNWCPNVTPR